MSSAVHFEFQSPVSRDAWNQFAAQNGIEYSPNTVGQNIFYGGTKKQVEIAFGSSNPEDLPTLPNGRVNFDAACPPLEAGTIQVSTFYMGDLEEVAEVARKVSEQFGGTVESDPELAALVPPSCSV